MTSINRAWLVIDDDREVMRELSASKFKGRYTLEETSEGAQTLLAFFPWRLVSHDLNLPKISGGGLNMGAGLTLFNNPRPLTRKLVYTGFRTTEEGMSAIDIGGTQDFWVLGKSARNEVTGRTAVASPLGWTALMRHLLGEPQPEGPLRQEAQEFLEALERVKPSATEPWARAYWRLAARHLPQPLAEAAARYEAAAQVAGGHASAGEIAVDRNGLLALNDFREWTLWLAAAQSAIILRQVRPLERAPNRLGSGAGAAHEWLTQQLRALHLLARTQPEVPGAAAWCNYLDIVEQPGVSSRGAIWHSAALDAMDVLRQARNQGVHGLKPRSVPEAELQLPAMMDLASHWANNPLLSHVRREQGRWRAKVMSGKDWVDRDLPEGLKLPPHGIEAGHVYQLVWHFPSGNPGAQDLVDRLGVPKPALLDWWPYLRWELNRESGQRECVLLTQPKDSVDDSRWQAQGFAGTPRLLTLSTVERTALTQPVG
jgi:hypothetical protein